MPGIPLDTSILTRSGWKNYNDFLSGSLNIGDEIRTYNYEKKQYEWGPLLNICFHESVPNFAINTPIGTFNAAEDQLWLVIENCKLEFYSSKSLQNLDGSDATRYNPNNLPIDKEKCKQMSKSKLLKLGFVEGLINPGDIENDTYNLSRVLVTPSGAQDTWLPLTDYRVYLIKQNNKVVLTGGNNDSDCEGVTSPIQLPILTLTSTNLNINPANSSQIIINRTNSLSNPITESLTVNLIIDSIGVNGVDYQILETVTFNAGSSSTTLNLSNLTVDPRLEELNVSISLSNIYRANELEFILS